MKYTLISTHLRTIDTKQQVMGLYFSHDGSTGTPYFISRDTSAEKIWISAEAAAGMLREDNAVLASRVPSELLTDLLDAEK